MPLNTMTESGQTQGNDMEPYKLKILQEQALTELKRREAEALCLAAKIQAKQSQSAEVLALGVSATLSELFEVKAFRK